MYRDDAIKKYIDDLAARLPAPGGGSAAGLCGALGAALLEMVCNFTAGKEKYKDVEQDIQVNLVSLKKIRDEFTAIIDEDVKAYSAIGDAFKTKDKKIIDKALKNGYDVCLKICELSKKAAVIGLDLSEKGNPNLITDVGCGVELLNAAFNSGVFNCEINLKGIEDRVFTEKEKTSLVVLIKDMRGLYKNSIAKTRQRMG